MREYVKARNEATIDPLLKTGYFTNTLLPIPYLDTRFTNETLIMDEAGRRLANHRHAITGFMSYFICETNMDLTCRASDLDLIKTALQRRERH